MLATVVTVMAVAIALTVGVGILSSSSEAADCSAMPGAVPAGTRTINVSTTVSTIPAGPCYTIVTVNRNVSTTTPTWGLERMECVRTDGRTNATARQQCDDERTSTLAKLDALGYTNVKPAGGCEPGDINGVPIGNSIPNSTNRDRLVYCFGRTFQLNAVAYLTTWTNQTNVTTYHIVPTPLNRTTTCAPVTSIVSTPTNVSHGTAFVPGSWAAACDQAAQQTRTAYALITLTVIIGGAVAVILAARYLGGDGG